MTQRNTHTSALLQIASFFSHHHPPTIMGFAKTAEPFVCGGSAATFASVIIHPIDLAKVCFTSFVGWKRLICAATHGTQCTYVSRPGRHKVPAMIGRKVPVASLGDLCPKFWMEAFALLRTVGPFATGTIEQASSSITLLSSAASASAFCDSSRVRSEKRSLAFGRPPIAQAASVTCQYFCYGDGAEGNTNQMRILFHPLSLS